MAPRILRPGLILAGVVMTLAVLAMLGGCDGSDDLDSMLYHVTDLGTLGGDYSGAMAINDLGHVVGGSALAGGDTDHAFLYTDGQMRDIGTLPGAGNSMAHDINNNGVICGAADVGEVNQRAFRYFNGQMQDIGTVAPWITADAEGVNDAGQIVGNSGGAAFLWENGQMRTLPTPGGPGIANAINRHGMVAGSFEDNVTSHTHAFRGSLTAAIDLGTLGATYSTANDINDDGDCVGFYGDLIETRAFIYRDGTMQDLGTLGGSQGDAWAINNRGVVVGSSRTATRDRHAFVWNGTMHDLNDLLDAASQGWTLTHATDINEGNVIVGDGFNPDGQWRAFIARPI